MQGSDPATKDPIAKSVSLKSAGGSSNEGGDNDCSAADIPGAFPDYGGLNEEQDEHSIESDSDDSNGARGDNERTHDDEESDDGMSGEDDVRRSYEHGDGGAADEGEESHDGGPDAGEGEHDGHESEHGGGAMEGDEQEYDNQANASTTSHRDPPTKSCAERAAAKDGASNDKEGEEEEDGESSGGAFNLARLQAQSSSVQRSLEAMLKLPSVGAPADLRSAGDFDRQLRAIAHRREVLQQQQEATLAQVQGAFLHLSCQLEAQYARVAEQLAGWCGAATGSLDEEAAAVEATKAAFLREQEDLSQLHKIYAR